MDWLKELLKKQGIEETKLDSAVSDIGKEIPKHFVPKAQYNEAAEAKKQAEKDRDTVNSQLEELKKSAGASEELKKQIETLQTENKTAKEKYEADLKELTLTNAIKSALTGKVHDEALVAGLFDKTKLVIDGDKVVGLEEQLKGIQTDKAFLFKSEDKGGNGGTGGFKVGGGGSQDGTGAATNEQLAAIFGVAGDKK